MNPIGSFEEALQNLDFERARMLADQAEGPEKTRLRRRVQASRAEATDRAEHLAARIQFLARADHYEGLLSLASDPTTEPLLALVSTELRRGAILHLDGAVRRQRRFRAAAQRHMKAAADALVLLDTGKAIGEIGKVDPRWLTESQQDELQMLRTQADDAMSERMELENRTAAVLREHLPDPPPERTPRTPISRMRPGCLGSLLMVVSALMAVAALLAAT